MVYKKLIRNKSYFLFSVICLGFVHLWNLSLSNMTPRLEVGVVAFIMGAKIKMNVNDASINDRLERQRVLSPPRTITKQQCKIPNLDPWHEDVLPFVDFTWRNRQCAWKQKGRVENGRMLIKIDNVQRAGFYYIRRKDDNTNSYSEYHVIRDDRTAVFEKETRSCIQLTNSKKGLVMVAKSVDSSIFVADIAGKPARSAAIVAIVSDVMCLPSSKFIFQKDNSIKHFLSGRCIIPKTKSLVLGESVNDCQRSDAKFELSADGILKHTSTGLCAFVNLVIDESAGFFTLKDCMNATQMHFSPQQDLYEDLDVSVPLDEDMVKMEYLQNNQKYTEYYNYPLNNKKKKKKKESNNINSEMKRKDKKKEDVEELNVLYLMIDSISRASAQRYLNSTYKMLEEDPNSVILKGHTIVGDGTTAQVLSIFTGDQEKNLPEARRGYDNSATVDGWPWIWKEFEKKGYTTIYGEDETDIGTFNYRLNGFDSPPTTKYMRPWYIEINDLIKQSKQISTDCSHKFFLPYLKNFYKEYSEEKKFVFHAANLGHNEPSKAASIDEELKDFLKHLNRTGVLSNSVVVIFGDHGDRTALFRKKMQGKLEERLPFVSLSFPAWFRRKYPAEMANLRRNADILTSHFDLYATNKHLLSFPYLPSRPEKYGRSLFSDIGSLNRACREAGVDETWCPCVNYEKVSTKDARITKIASRVVDAINNNLKTIPTIHEHCQPLTLKTIHRASHVTTNKHVEYFVETYDDGECDECGKIMNTTSGFVKLKYEIVFEVEPSGGQYEVMVDYDIEKDDIVAVDGTNDFMEKISRINRYGDQPSCIAHEFPYYRKFCYCKDHMPH